MDLHIFLWNAWTLSSIIASHLAATRLARSSDPRPISSSWRWQDSGCEQNWVGKGWSCTLGCVFERGMAASSQHGRAKWRAQLLWEELSEHLRNSQPRGWSARTLESFCSSYGCCLWRACCEKYKECSWTPCLPLKKSHYAARFPTLWGGRGRGYSTSPFINWHHYTRLREHSFGLLNRVVISKSKLHWRLEFHLSLSAEGAPSQPLSWFLINNVVYVNICLHLCVFFLNGLCKNEWNNGKVLNTEKTKTEMIHRNDPPVFGGKLSIYLFFM